MSTAPTTVTVDELQALEQKVPGFNWVFSGEELSGKGTLSTTTIGYRYLIQIGFRF